MFDAITQNKGLNFYLVVVKESDGYNKNKK